MTYQYNIRFILLFYNEQVSVLNDVGRQHSSDYQKRDPSVHHCSSVGCEGVELTIFWWSLCSHSRSFYFSQDNLWHDMYFRRLMDAAGWILIKDISVFPRLKVCAVLNKPIWPSSSSLMSKFTRLPSVLTVLMFVQTRRPSGWRLTGKGERLTLQTWQLRLCLDDFDT